MSEQIKTVKIDGLDWEKTANLAWEKLKAIGEKHYKIDANNDGSCGDEECCGPVWDEEPDWICAECEHQYPCATRELLDGEQE